MPAKIYISKDIQKALAANDRVVADLGLCATQSFLGVLPEGVLPERTLSQVRRTERGHLQVELAYRIDNVPAYGTWTFSFMYINSLTAVVSVTRYAESAGLLDSRCGPFTMEALAEAVKALASA